jgi:futalosine hydrolase
MQRSYARAISIGIAGSFTENISIGETVQITEDYFADLGIDNNGQFRGLREEGLNCDDFASNPSPTLSSHRKVRGITVQTVSGSRQRIDDLIERFHPQVETMENAAFFYVCHQLHVPFASFRAISNKIEPRNRKNWQIAEAVESVCDALCNLLGK